MFCYGLDFRLGYVWPVSRGLHEEFGDSRVRDAPISEKLHVGMAVGAAMAGAKPVVELQYSDFAMLAMDPVVNQAAKMHFMTGGQAKTGFVLRLPYGHMRNYGAQHSQNLYSLFTHIPGLRVVAPATPADAAGLMLTAIDSDAPVMFFEHKQLYPITGAVPEDISPLPFGNARVYEGSGAPSAVIIAIGWMVQNALKAQEELQSAGVSVTVVDLRSLMPVDLETIVPLVNETGRVVLADDAVLQGGFTGWLAAEISEHCFGYLHAPVARVGVPDIPIPYTWVLEDAAIPGPAAIIDAVRRTLAI